MLPDDIKKMIHEIRVVGNFEEKYNGPDDQQVLQTILSEQHMQMPSGSSGDWSSVKQILADKKKELKKRSDEFYRNAYW